MARAVGRAVLWLLCGLAGSLAILFVVSDVVDWRGYPKLQSGRVSTDFWDRGYVSAVGTWVFEGDTKQVVSASDHGDQVLSRHEGVSFGAGGHRVWHADGRRPKPLPITSWDSQSIVFFSEGNPCVSYVFTISRSTERVTGQWQPKPSTSAECSPREKRTVNLSLRDGFLVWQQLRAEDKSVVLPIMYGVLGTWWAFIVYRIVRTNFSCCHRRMRDDPFGAGAKSQRDLRAAGAMWQTG